MRLTDDRYAAERSQFELALRMIRHEARTRTIRECTGLSDDRIRKLYATYFRNTGASDVRRRRGKSPQQIMRFVRKPENQLQATTLVALYAAGRLIRIDAENRAHPCWPRPGVEFGHRFGGLRRRAGPGQAARLEEPSERTTGLVESAGPVVRTRQDAAHDEPVEGAGDLRLGTAVRHARRAQDALDELGEVDVLFEEPERGGDLALVARADRARKLADLGDKHSRVPGERCARRRRRRATSSA